MLHPRPLEISKAFNRIVFLLRLRFVSNRFWASDECRAADEAPEAGCNWLDGKWHYLELDVAGMLQKNFSGATLTTLDALIVRGRTVYLDDPVAAGEVVVVCSDIGHVIHIKTLRAHLAARECTTLMLRH